MEPLEGPWTRGSFYLHHTSDNKISFLGIIKKPMMEKATGWIWGRNYALIIIGETIDDEQRWRKSLWGFED